MHRKVQGMTIKRLRKANYYPHAFAEAQIESYEHPKIYFYVALNSRNGIDERTPDDLYDIWTYTEPLDEMDLSAEIPESVCVPLTDEELYEAYSLTRQAWDPNFEYETADI